MKPEIKVYIKAGSVFKYNGRYEAYVSTNPDYVEKNTTYYEYTLKLPQEEAAYIEAQGEVTPTTPDNQ